MGTRIATNVDSLRGLQSVAKANELQSRTLTRLSTGTQINSGKDNPSGLIGSETLRSQVTAIEQSIKNSNRANNVIGTADAALGEVNNLIDQIRGLVQEGVNKGALSQTEIDANQSQIDAALGAINRITANTTFAGDKLLDGSKSFTTVLTSADKAKVSDYQINEALFGSSSTVTVDATVVTAAKKGTLTYNSGNLLAATTLQVSGAKGSQVLFFGNGTTATNITDAINNTSDVTGVTAAKTAATAATYAKNGANGLLLTDARQDAGSTDPVGVTFTANAGTAARSVSVSGTAITVNLATTGGVVDATETGTNIAAAIAANTSAAALVTATAAGTGATVLTAAAATNLSGGVNAVITLTSSDYGSKQFADVNVLNGTFATLNSAAASATREAGTDIVARINGQNAYGSGLKASISTGLLNASVTFASGSNVALTNAKVTITGGGSLFQIGENVTTAGQVGVGIDAINTARLGGVTGKLYELASGSGKSLNDVGPSVQGSTLVDIINQARDRVTTLRARLGALQKNVIETNISSLGVALTNISAARSDIADTDFAVETANLTKSQILSQAGISTLQIANSSPQQVLTLLRG